MPPGLHAEPSNTGQSGLVTCGDYVGGKCWTWDDVNGKVAIQEAVPIRNRPDISVGDVTSGNLHVTNEDMVIFDATTPHCVEPHVGARYSITDYTLARCQ